MSSRVNYINSRYIGTKFQELGVNSKYNFHNNYLINKQFYVVKLGSMEEKMLINKDKIHFISSGESHSVRFINPFTIVSKDYIYIFREDLRKGYCYKKEGGLFCILSSA